jgi:hypothetical protein
MTLFYFGSVKTLEAVLINWNNTLLEKYVYTLFFVVFNKYQYIGNLLRLILSI